MHYFSNVFFFNKRTNSKYPNHRIQYILTKTNLEAMDLVVNGATKLLHNGRIFKSYHRLFELFRRAYSKLV